MTTPFQLPIISSQLSINGQCSMINEKFLKIGNCKLKIASGGGS